MEVLYSCCCGLDVHKKSITACVLWAEPKGKKRQQKRVFQTFTRDLLTLAEWLKECGVTPVALESTGVYFALSSALIGKSRPLSRRSGCVSAEPYPPLRSVQSTRDARLKKPVAVYTKNLTHPNQFPLGGSPFTPSLSFDAANAGTVTRPNRTCDGNISSRTLQRYFDTSCFSAGTSYVFGNSGRNVLRAPGIDNLDFSIQRDFRLPLEHETILNFRMETFNSLNHPQFAAPGATVGSTTYGVITSTSTDNRQLQFGVRVAF